tara:strand:+ start:788 stop:1075 length:288 start_codon:yes stop_codon:yes gene_type:complete
VQSSIIMPLLLQQMLRRDSENCSIAPNSVSASPKPAAMMIAHGKFVALRSLSVAAFFLERFRQPDRCSRHGQNHLHEKAPFKSRDPVYCAVQHFS